MQVEKDLSHRNELRPAVLSMVLLAACGFPLLAQNDPRQAAIAFEQQGRLPEAEAAWKALSTSYPNNPEPLAHLGLLEARQEHYPAAIAFYRKALALDPKMSALRINLGLALFKAGEYQQAIAIFDPLYKAQPSSEEAQRLAILLGMSHYGLGEYAAAAPYLRQASEHDSNNLPLLLTLAHSCLYSRQYQCVEDAFHHIVALNAESAEAHMLMGEALDDMKDTLGAIREFRAAVAANPREPNVHFGLGYLLWKQGQTEEAAKEFDAELANDPMHTQAMLYLADASIQLNHFDAAEPLLKKALEMNPRSSMGHLDLGIVYTQADRKQEALAELKTAAELKPDDVNPHWRMGRLYRSMGKSAEAKAEFDRASKLNKAADENLLKVMSRVPHADAPSSAPQK